MSEETIGYTPESYISEKEKQMIRTAFRNNPELLKVLRKFLLPTFADPDFPIEQLRNDVFLRDKEWSQVPEHERGTLIVARQEAVNFVANALVNLKVIAHEKEETEAEKKERQKKDSNK